MTHVTTCACRTRAHCMTPIHCTTLHHTAPHCTTQQHTAPHSNTLPASQISFFRLLGSSAECSRHMSANKHASIAPRPPRTRYCAPANLKTYPPITFLFFTLCGICIIYMLYDVYINTCVSHKYTCITDGLMSHVRHICLIYHDLCAPFSHLPTTPLLPFFSRCCVECALCILCTYALSICYMMYT